MSDYQIANIILRRALLTDLPVATIALVLRALFPGRILICRPF